jgi:hypothetical protein
VPDWPKVSTDERKRDSSQDLLQNANKAVREIGYIRAQRQKVDMSARNLDYRKGFWLWLKFVTGGPNPRFGT